mgnify:CR=1 FL=1
MPTYEYACESCRHGFEVEQRIYEDPLTKCPDCGKPSLKRLVGTGNFLLKGGGWYSDLYSGPSNKKGASSSSSSGGD